MQTINLSIDLVNQILAYMGKRPFEEVYLLVGAIQQQAQPQLPPAEAPGEPQAEPVEPASE